MAYSRIARQAFATSFVPWFLASGFVFLINGFIWASLFEHYFPDVGGSFVSFAGASLSLIVGTVYSTWLKKMLQDYLSAPTMYLKLLVHIGNAGDSIAGISHGGDGGAMRVSMIRIKAMLQHLAFYSYRIFAPDNRDRLGLVEERPIVPLGAAGRYSLAELAEMYPVTYKIEALPDDLNELVTKVHLGESSPLRFAHDLRRYLYNEIANMRRADLDMEVIHMALRTLKPVWNQLEEIESGRLVEEPAIFALHMKALFVFYFFLWVPVSSWAAIGLGWTVVTYPIVSMAFLGIGVYNAWLGSAFDPSRPVLVADLLGAREKYAVTEMERKFEEK